jgi:hypothetical protein
MATKNLTVVIVLFGCWSLHCWDVKRHERENFAQLVSERSLETDEAGNVWGYAYLARGFSGKDFALLGGATDRVACDSYVSAMQHEKTLESARVALRAKGFTEISCQDVTGKLE